MQLETARFSLEGWLTLTKGEFASGDIWLKQGAPAGKAKNSSISFPSITSPRT